ncbi:MAG: ATP-binding protein [Myxococcaceae bacterium]
MDARKNPFAPGAGTQPPELAGRSGVMIDAEVALARTRGGKGKSALFLGLRGVGKTVLLYKVAEMAHSCGCVPISLEAPEDQRLAQMLVPSLRAALFKLSGSEKASQHAKNALGVLRAFASVFKARVGDVEFGVKPESGTADSGNLEHDLAALLTVVAEAAQRDGSGLALFVDEMQYLNGEDLSALIVAVHKVGQRGLPLVLFGAGLPQLAALAGEAKSYAERLFDFPVIGPLTPAAAAEAIRTPLTRENVDIEPEALEFIVTKTLGYPYFLQEWGYQAWNVGTGSPITLADAKVATAGALARLDSGFFKVRFDRLTPKEKEYMRAMASLGPGPHRSGDIAGALKKTVKSVAPLRDGLIKKGVIFSPQHGDTAFTVPMFDEFMQRAIPAG